MRSERYGLNFVRTMISELGMLCALCLCLLPATSLAESGTQTRGQILAPGISYVTAVMTKPIPGRLSRGNSVLAAFEKPSLGAIPVYSKNITGTVWKLVTTVREPHSLAERGWKLEWEPHFYRVPKETLSPLADSILLVANAVQQNVNGNIQGESLQLFDSTSNGRKWNYISTIVNGSGSPDNTRNSAVWEPNIIARKSGLLVAYYSTEQYKKQGYNQAIAERESKNYGRTWGVARLVVARKGGVERPGMPVVVRLPNDSYVMSYEDIDGPKDGQVYLKFSSDAIHWGIASFRGTPVQTESGIYPAACPVVEWIPNHSKQGLIVVTSQRGSGGGDFAGHSLFFNTDLGVGPWWRAPLPVRKLTSNVNAGWTQMLLVQPNNQLLHITSSGNPNDPRSPSHNNILYASSIVNFSIYEAADAFRRNAVLIPDRNVRGGQKVRIDVNNGIVSYAIISPRSKRVTISFSIKNVSYPADPLILINGVAKHNISVVDSRDGGGWTTLDCNARLKSGNNTISIMSRLNPIDIRYITLMSSI